MDKQPKDHTADAADEARDKAWARNFAAGVSSGGIGICVVFISTILALGSKALDTPLQFALGACAVALPLFALALLLLTLYGQRALELAYGAASGGAGVLAGGICGVLFHLDQFAGRMFVAASLIGVLVAFALPVWLRWVWPRLRTK